MLRLIACSPVAFCTKGRENHSSWPAMAGDNACRYSERHLPARCDGTLAATGIGDTITSAQTNQTPVLTLTLTLTPTLWGVRGRQGQSLGSEACVGGVLPKQSRAAERLNLDLLYQHPAQVLCLPVLADYWNESTTGSTSTFVRHSAVLPYNSSHTVDRKTHHPTMDS